MKNGILGKCALAVTVSLLYCHSLEASSPPVKGSGTFSYRTRLGKGEDYRVDLSGSEVAVNGIILSAEKRVVSVLALSRVLHPTPTRKFRACRAGEYQHSVTRKSVTVSEEGCLEDPEFKEVLSSFKQLQD